MSLEILRKNEVFYLNGKLNTLTARSFIFHFELMIKQLNTIVINIDNINEIDKDGLEAIKKIKNLAFKKNKTFSIIGYGCKEIYDDFNHNNVA